MPTSRGVALPLAEVARRFAGMNLVFAVHKRLLQQAPKRLAQDLVQAEQAARAAHEAAPHEEHIAENKHDTLGLETACLATGQARRAGAIGQAMANWLLPLQSKLS